MNSEPISFENLSDWLRKWILVDNADLKLTDSFIRYLIDLDVLTLLPPEKLFISEIPKANLSDTIIQSIFIEILNRVANTEKGFAIGYFLRSKLNQYIPKNPPEILKETKTSRPVRRSLFSAPGKASDLSNLQIVKKVGKQLLPFLELENKYISLLQGSNASKEDAKRLFQKILPQIKEKGEPKNWEQLSRRRHK